MTRHGSGAVLALATIFEWPAVEVAGAIRESQCFARPSQVAFSLERFLF